jgi:nitric oxide reductase NorQ protein
MSIRTVLYSNFDSNNSPCSFEQAQQICTEAGLSLSLGTYRVNKSNWLRERERKVIATPSAIVQVAPVVNDFKVENPDIQPDDDLKEFFVPPKMDSTHIVNEDMVALFEAIENSSKKTPQNVRLNGPAGCGKTTTAMEFAAIHNRPLLVMDCPNIREARDWFGYKTIDSKGSIVWHKSLFSRMVQHDNAVIVLDEVNRLNPMICNTLLPLLDSRRSTYLEEAGSKITVGKGVVFFATTNEGREFTGTTSLDLANADRFSNLIEVTYLPSKDEEKLLVDRTGVPAEDASKLVGVANQVRRKYLSDSADSFSKAISTRILLNAADKLVSGGYKTMRYTLLSHFNSEGGESSERAQLLKLLQGKFGPVFA